LQVIDPGHPKEVINCADALLGVYLPYAMAKFFLLQEPTGASAGGAGRPFTSGEALQGYSPLNWSISADGKRDHHNHPSPESVAGTFDAHRFILSST